MIFTLSRALIVQLHISVNPAENSKPENDLKEPTQDLRLVYLTVFSSRSKSSGDELISIPGYFLAAIYMALGGMISYRSQALG